MEQLLEKIRACHACSDLPRGPKPIVQGASGSRIVIISQAPGWKAHESAVPFDDASGERLRDWLGLSPEQFYNPDLLAIMPMGFCYPGKAKSGDLPPRKICSQLWHGSFLSKLQNRRLTLLIGNYAQNAYLDSRKKTGTEKIKSWEDYGPDYIPLPHPSPLNNIWLAKNPWFESEVIPEIKKRVKAAIEDRPFP